MALAVLPPSPEGELPSRTSHLRRLPLRLLGMLILALASVTLALLWMPGVPVTTAGARVSVDAVMRPSLSGPVEVEWLNRRTHPNLPVYSPIRPYLAVETVDRDRFAEELKANGPRAVGSDIARALSDHWKIYFLGLSGLVVVLSAVLHLVLTSFRARSLRSRARGAARAATASLSLLLALAAAGIFPALETIRTLNGIGGWSELIGTATFPSVIAPSGPELGDDITTAVIGDSVAAGFGGPPLTNATAQDKMCRRSSDSLASNLARSADWGTVNLACASATITPGACGPQKFPVTDQVAALKRIPNLKRVIVAVGANDGCWSDLVALCYGAARCDDELSAQYFERRLDQLVPNHYGLFGELADLPTRPLVVAVLYYDIWDPERLCRDTQAEGRPGLDEQKIRLLNARTAQLNRIIERDAQIHGFLVARPDFRGHELCTDLPFVYGAEHPGRFHPNAAGQAAIAMAVQGAILEGGVKPEAAGS